MNVLLLAPHPFYQERGTPIAVRFLASALAEDGHVVDILTYHEGQDVAFEGAVRIHRSPKPLLVGGIRPGFSLKKLACDAFMFPAALRLARAGRYDAVHAVEESVFMAMRIRRRFGVPYVFDMDSSMPQQLAEKSALFRPLRPCLEWFETRAIRGAAAVAPMCQSLAEMAAARGAARTVVLHDVPLFDPRAPAAPADLPPLPKPCFMYVGNLEGYQGVGLLIESFALYAAQGGAGSLVIVGGAEAHVRGYRRLADRSGAGARIFLVGPRPVAMMPSLFAAADVLVSPRVKGVNTPMKIYSYLLSGKPVLATDIASHTQVLDAEIAVLSACRAADMADGMRRLAEDTALRARLAQNAAKRVQEKYSLSSFKARVRELYDGLARFSRGTSASSPT